MRLILIGIVIALVVLTACNAPKVTNIVDKKAQDTAKELNEPIPNADVNTVDTNVDSLDELKADLDDQSLNNITSDLDELKDLNLQ